jgi:hypothetical protein
MDVHGSEDQEKDASPPVRERHDASHAGAWASKSTCGRRSLPRRPLDIRCRRCVAGRGGAPLPTTDRPRSAFRRHPAKETAIPQTGMPFHRHDRKGSPARITPSRLPCAGLSLTPPTRSPLGRGAFTGIASTTVRSPAIRGLRETSRLYNLLDFYVPGTNDPSTPAWLGRRDRSRRLIASARFYADRSA